MLLMIDLLKGGFKMLPLLVKKTKGTGGATELIM